jgi:hypothetical protein
VSKPYVPVVLLYSGLNGLTCLSDVHMYSFFPSLLASSFGSLSLCSGLPDHFGVSLFPQLANSLLFFFNFCWFYIHHFCLIIPVYLTQRDDSDGF